MPDSDHNLAGGIASDQLRAYVTRVENLEEEIAGLNGDKREIYAEAKSAGFDVPAIKKVIARRRKEPEKVEEEDLLVEVYERAINGGLPKERDPLD